ncbi:MAG: type II toxin-antitoxin system PemK/MazF family toxin [Dermatophilaceae bacterium]
MRGDVHELKAPRGSRGREQRGRRYAVVVQSDSLPLSTWLVAPTSTSARPASFRPEIEIVGQACRVLTEQTAAVDAERLGAVVGHLSPADLSTVDAALRVVLGLDPAIGA